MILLVFLLLGERALKRDWNFVCGGRHLDADRFDILFDLGDGALSVVLDTLAIFLVTERTYFDVTAVAFGNDPYFAGVIDRYATRPMPRVCGPEA